MWSTHSEWNETVTLKSYKLRFRCMEATSGDHLPYHEEAITWDHCGWNQQITTGTISLATDNATSKVSSHTYSSQETVSLCCTTQTQHVADPITCKQSANIIQIVNQQGLKRSWSATVESQALFAQEDMRDIDLNDLDCEASTLRKKWHLHSSAYMKLTSRDNDIDNAIQTTTLRLRRQHSKQLSLQHLPRTSLQWRKHMLERS